MAAMRYREALNQAMREEMQADESVFLMGEDVGVFQGAFKVTEGLLEEFGEKRVRDTPISENTIVGMGVGAAMAGLRPIVEIMTVNFALLAMDQIINSAAHIHYMFGGQAKVPLVVRFPQGGGIEHLRVTFVDPGKHIVLTGALGPLLYEATAGVLDIQIKSTGAGSQLIFDYRAAGFYKGGADKLAPIVDQVLADQVKRYRVYATARPRT